MSMEEAIDIIKKRDQEIGFDLKKWALALMAGDEKTMDECMEKQRAWEKAHPESPWDGLGLAMKMDDDLLREKAQKLYEESKKKAGASSAPTPESEKP